MKRLLVAYDISKDKKRAKVAKYLKNFAIRVQKSVFKSRRTKKDLDPAALADALAQIVDDDDDIRVQPLCAQCAAKVELRGRLTHDEDDDDDRGYDIV